MDGRIVDDFIAKQRGAVHLAVAVVATVSRVQTRDYHSHGVLTRIAGTG